jgi:Ser/Thr protein kinase RdoA (MazF antagonist)
LDAFGLAGPVAGMKEVGGAWSNRVYRLKTGGIRFAVKEMRNPWANPRWAEWLEEAWAFEQQAIAAGVSAPEPIPNPTDGGCLAWVARVNGGSSAAVRVHHWVDGPPFDTGPVEPDVAAWAGAMLARLHRLRITPRDRSLFPVANTDTADGWSELVDAAGQAGVTWADQVAAAAPAVATIAELARAAGHRPEAEVMTHGDIDQKNLIAGPAGPVLCDWDLAAPLVPRRELADVAVSLAAWRRFDIARDVVRSYRHAGGDDDDIEPSDLGQPMAIGLDWVAFNIERVIGRRPANPAERALAASLVPGLLDAIPRHAETALRIGDLLRF